MKNFLFLTLGLCLCQFWNTSQFMKISIQQHGHNLLQILFLLSPGNKHSLCMGSCSKAQICVGNFCWSVISVFVFLSDVVMFCRFLRKWLKEQGAVHQHGGRSWCSLQAWQCKTLPNYQTASITSLMPYLLQAVVWFVFINIFSCLIQSSLMLNVSVNMITFQGVMVLSFKLIFSGILF